MSEREKEAIQLYKERGLYLDPDVEEAARKQEGKPTYYELNNLFSNLLQADPYKIVKFDKFTQITRADIREYLQNHPRGTTDRYTWTGAPGALLGVWRVALHRLNLKKIGGRGSIVLTFEELLAGDTFAFLAAVNKAYKVIQKDSLSGKLLVRDITGSSSSGILKSFNLDSFKDLRVIRVVE